MRQALRPLLALSLPLLTACGPPTLFDVQRDVFTPRCANAACHSGEQPPLGLDLSEGNTWSSTVDVDSVAVPGKVRVVPGDPSESLLYLVTQEPVAPVRRMPVGFPLEDSERELVRRWIEAGAPSE